jgi:uncharacterized protein (DUF1778 family)
MKGTDIDAQVISNPQYLSVKAAAMEIGMSADFVLESIIYPKKVEAVKFGARWRIELTSWQRFLAGLKRAA